MITRKMCSHSWDTDEKFHASWAKLLLPAQPCRILSHLRDNFFLRNGTDLTIIQVVFVPDRFWQKPRQNDAESMTNLQLIGGVD